MKTIKKTKVKRLLSLLLALMMIILAMPMSGMSVFAATSGDFEYMVLKSGTAEITKYNGNATNLVIPSEIDGYKVTSIGDCAFEQEIPTIIDLTIPDTVTKIGDSAFRYHSVIQKIKLSKNITEIGNYAFMWCTNLEKIEIPNSVISIGDLAFWGCQSFVDISIPANVTKIGSGAFSRCQSLKKITVDQSNKNYCDVNGVLFNKDKTEILTYPGAMASFYELPIGVTKVGDRAFAGTDIKGVKMSNDVIAIGDEAFSNCTGLLNVTIPGSVIKIGESAFFLCDGLKEVDLNYGVREIEADAFADCYALTKVSIPESVDYIGDKAFGYTLSGGKSVNDNDDMYSYDDNGKMNGFKIYGELGTAAETYASENDFEFIALDKAADESTGISVSEKELNVIPDGAQLKAVQLSAEENKIEFDISIIKDGAEVQPNGEVMVKIPVPEGIDNSILKVYREEADDTFTDMNAYFSNGYMVFTTDHFSKYILTTEEPSSVLPGDINSDGKVTAVDARWVLQIAAGTREVPEAERKSVDLNKDGKITAVDARWVLQIAAGTRVV